MKKNIILLLTTLTTLNPLMSVHASNIEAQTSAQIEQQPVTPEPERPVAGESTEAQAANEDVSSPATEEQGTIEEATTTEDAQEQITASEPELELNTLAAGRVVEGAFTYHLDQFNQVKYREHRDAETRKVDYAEEYYPGTVYGRDNIANGRKSIYIKMTNATDELVAFRAKIDKNRQEWTEVEEYKRPLKWSYGFSYEYHWTIRFFVEADKTIKYAYTYGNDWKKVVHRLDYYAGAKYGEGHQWQEMLRNSQNWNIKDGNSRIHMNYLGEVKYVENLDPNTNKVISAYEYLPGTIYKRDNLEQGKKFLYAEMTNNRDEIVAFRALINKETQAWYEIEEYNRSMKWAYGTGYGFYLSAKYFVEPDKTIKYAYGYEGNYTDPTYRLDYAPGTKYGQNHRAGEILLNRYDWNVRVGNQRIHMNKLGEVKFVENIDPSTNRVVAANEYYPGTVYKRDNIERGKKSIYIEMTNNRDQIVRYRARIDKDTQHWTEVEEYNKPMGWAYGTWYERHYKRRYFLTGPNWTIRWMDEYSDDDTEFVHERVEYHPGTRFGDNHASKVARRIPWKQYKPQPKPKWIMPVDHGYIYCVFDQCTNSAYGGRHNGTDIPVRTGTEVKSIADGGTVTMSTWSESLGNVVGVHYRVDNIDFYVVYAHLDSRSVSFGDVVRIGQRIGLSGNTGWSEGPHLHIEVQKDVRGFIGSGPERLKYSLPLSWIFGNHVGLGYQF